MLLIRRDRDIFPENSNNIDTLVLVLEDNEPNNESALPNTDFVPCTPHVVVFRGVYVLREKMRSLFTLCIAIYSFM